ncbi:hypothetical protein L1987_29961 [Smallanthus sonchifolius]|uniref:Uncharacterized protein n=1 Tax=Smallanthus sonchifolius TaxID=185202 RepID=A0ACB9I1I0_9ASTR|nr:hypothetical protein L1987_29961 [Smallanthus sonchifolius]
MAAFNFHMVVFITMVASMAFCSSATQHTVGDGVGWRIPDNPNLYSEWASRNIITVGDSLLFNFMMDDVAEVSKEDYDQCSLSNPGSSINNSPATISLITAGDHYFISSLEGHCSFHQKLAINVVMAETVGF